MAWAYVASAFADTAADGTTLDCTSSLNIEDGDIIVGFASFGGSDTTISIEATSGAVNAFTISSHVTTAAVFGAIGRKIEAVANATSTFRLTLGASRTYRSIFVMQYRPDAGETVTLEAGPAPGTGTGTLATSGAISPSGDDLMVVAGFRQYDQISSTYTIAGGAATGSVSDGIFGALWYKAFTSSQVGITATAALDNQQWIIDILAFKSVAAAGVTLEQEGFRARNDDGNEAAATWLADQDVNITRAKNLNTRLRMLLNAAGDPPANAYRIEVRKQGVGDYKKIN